VNSDLGGMKHLSTAVQTFDQTQHRVSNICRRFIMKSKYLAMVGIKLDHSRNVPLNFVLFCFFCKRNPKYFARTSKHHVILLYHIRQVLR